MLFYEQLQEAGHWVNAVQVGPLWGNLEVETVEAANVYRSYQIQPVKADQLDEQQKIADAFVCGRAVAQGSGCLGRADLDAITRRNEWRGSLLISARPVIHQTQGHPDCNSGKHPMPFLPRQQ